MEPTNQNNTEKVQNTQNSSIVNQSKEQEIANYNQIISVEEKSHSSFNKIQEQSKIEIEQKNIQMLIFQRSLYIMKQRFSQNKKETELVYDKYKNSNYKSLECISTQKLFECYKEVFNTNQINLYPYENFNDLSTADLVSGINEEKYNKMINELVQFTKKNIVKYNEKFYENKMKKKKLKEEEELKNLKELEKNDISDKIKMVHINKRGEIISDFQKITETNKKVVMNELIYTVTEEDMTILTSNQLLYYGVIPLIIADFIQIYMEQNIKIGIIITNRSFYHENEDLLLEQNIKAIDKEIMKLQSNLNKIDPIEEKDEDLRKLLFESNSIDNKIKLYNELIMENSKKGEDISYLMEMIMKLKTQKSSYQKKISEINTKKISLNYNVATSNSMNYSRTINPNISNISKNNYSLKSQNINTTKKVINTEKNKLTKINKTMNNSKNSSKVRIKLVSKKVATKEDIRNNILKEIFSFYCKQHSFLGKTPTFGDLLTKEELMNISEFNKFCIDFKILVKKDRIARIFKQSIKDATLMTYHEFIQCIKKMANLMHEEKKNYKLDKINFYQLKLKELTEKEKKKKNKKEEEEKNNAEQQNIDQIVMTNQEKDLNNNNENNENNENQNVDENIKQENNNNNSENDKNKEEEKKENNEENKEINDEENNEQKKANSKSSSKEKKKLKKVSKKIISETKEDLEEIISKLELDYQILEQKTEVQILEEFYEYLQIDDPSKYEKKLKGYVRPFMVREDDTRNPKKNVKHPIKFNQQSIMRKYEYFLQRKDDIKKQKEIQYNKEKNIKYEERKKTFNKKLKRLEKNYNTKIKKDNYIQLKKNEEDYIKEKNNKVTWKYIQKNDFQTFLLNEENNIDINTFPSQLKDIFVNKSDYINDLGEDEHFINKIYSNKSSKMKKNFSKSKVGNNENSRYDGSESFSKFSNLSFE